MVVIDVISWLDFLLEVTVYRVVLTGCERIRSPVRRQENLPDYIIHLLLTKVEIKASFDHMDQNRDYNGWTKDVNRNMMLA